MMSCSSIRAGHEGVQDSAASFGSSAASTFGGPQSAAARRRNARGSSWGRPRRYSLEFIDLELKIDIEKMEKRSECNNDVLLEHFCFGVNKMDCDTAGYKKDRYDEISNEMESMLIKVGGKKDCIEKNTPLFLISGWMGDNLLENSEKITWRSGMDVVSEGGPMHVDTLYDVLDEFRRVPQRPFSATMRRRISGIYKIKGVGDVLARGTPDQQEKIQEIESKHKNHFEEIVYTTHDLKPGEIPGTCSKRFQD